MNTNAIKRYAPKARTAFIAAMSKRAALFGIRESTVLWDANKDSSVQIKYHLYK